MPTIIGVHGILYDYLGEEITASAWEPALHDRSRRSGRAGIVDQVDIGAFSPTPVATAQTATIPLSRPQADR